MTGESISTLLKWMAVGTICFAYNKPISNEIARLYWLPFKWIFGEKPWIITGHQYLSYFVRFTLYGGVFVSLIGIVLTVGNLFDL